MAEKLIIFCHSSILIIKMYIRQTEEEQTSKNVGRGAKERKKWKIRMLYNYQDFMP